MATESAMDDFDWVSAQAGCQVDAMFQRLLDGARKDVDRRNAAGSGRKDKSRFELNVDDENAFEVARTGETARSSAFVTFEREGPRINIAGDGVDVQLTAITGINHAGECRYYIGEQEYLGWEVRKMALEPLFFEEAEPD
jgi:hypothetical protein